ncbi:uncharacterized protein LOC128998791 [Macrosteles quadrilineatus]|uniref:uncharacterized protein LOC128998791 n=1 Tax=Macrosteles quadrilineatus TaxID=74068 RepID=UPI0023E33FBE|nr:uncharacterized protein LOC128998791 [Macrosteles quadrilineatus]
MSASFYTLASGQALCEQIQAHSPTRRLLTLLRLPPLPPVQLDDGFTEMALTPAADEPSLEQLKEISGGLFDDYVPRVSVEEVVKMAVDFENPPVEPVYPQSFLSMANLSDDEETFDHQKERPFLRIIEQPAEQPFPDPVEVERVIAQINTEDPSAQKHRHMKDKTKPSCDNQGRLFWGDEIAASSSPIPTSSKGKEPQKKLTTLVSISPICPVDRVRKTKVDTSSQTEREEPQPNEIASGAADQASAEPAIVRPANVPFQVYVEEEEDLPPARPNRQSYHPGLEILLGTPDPDHPSVRVPQRNPLADIVDEPVRRRRRQANQESMFISTLTRRTYGSLRHTYESFRGNFDSGSKLKNEVAGYIIRQEFLSDEDEEDQGWRYQHVLEPPRSGWPLAEDDILDNDWLRFSWRDHFQWRQFTDEQHEIRPDPVLPENFRYDRAPLVSDMVRMTYPNWDDAHYNIQDLLAPIPPPEEVYQQDQAGAVGQSTSREPTPARVTGEFQTPSLRIAHSHSSKDTLKSFGSSILAPPSSVSSGTEIVKSIGSSGLGLAPVEEEQEVTAGPSGEGAQPALPSGSAPDVWWLNPATEQPAQDPHEPATEQPAQETVQPAQGPPGDHQVQVQPEPPLPEAGRAEDFVFAVPEVPRRSTRARDPVNYREPVEDRPRRKRRRRKRNPNANQGDAAQVPQEVPQVQEPPQYDQPADLPPADFPAPQADVPAPEADVPAPETDVPAPQADVPAPETDVPAPETDVPAPETDVPAPEADVPPFLLDVPAAVDERYIV